MQLKAVHDSNRQVQLSLARKSLTTESKNDEHNDDDDDDDDTNLDEFISRTRNIFHDDTVERLSDTDSDVVEMEQTLKELRDTKREYMSLLPIPNIGEKSTQHVITTTVDLTKLSVNDVGAVVKNIRTINRNNPSTYESFETMPSQILTDTGRWSNSMTSTFSNNMNPSSLYQPLNGFQPFLSKTNHWSSQPTLVTRDAVLKAARKVFAPGVVDQLTSSAKSSTR